MTLRAHIVSIVVAFGGLSVAGELSAQCSVTPLSSGAVVVNSVTPKYFSFEQTLDSWAAVAVRSTAGNDWDLTVFDEAAPSPTCVTGTLANSVTGSGVDFVIGDFNHTPVGTDHVRVNRDVGAGSGYVEWHQGGIPLVPNGAIFTVATSISDVITVFEATLTAGVPYRIYFWHDVAVDAKVLLFKSNGATYWAGRSSAVLVSDNGFDYTPPTTDVYGIVVVNDNGGTGGYQVGVGTCTAPTALASGVAHQTVQTYSFYTFDPSHIYWSAIGARGFSDVGNWFVHASSGGGGADYPFCFSGPLGASTQSNKVNFVIGDFNHNPLGTYYARAARNLGQTRGMVEWDGGPHSLIVNGPRIFRDTDQNDVLETWDVHLTAGTPYTFSFGHFDVDAKLLLFRNSGTTYWGDRGDAVFEVSGNSTYTAPATDWYGVVVVNDDGATGSYYLQVGTCSTPFALTSGTSVSTSLGQLYCSIAATGSNWMGVGVRGLAGDWDIDSWSNPSGSIWPFCFSGQLAASVDVGRVDLVVGDWNHNADGTYYVRPNLFSGDGPGRIEWDDGPDNLAVDGAPVVRSTGSTDVLEVWDVFLAQGSTYGIRFLPTGAALKALLFHNPGTTYWAPRDAAVLEAGGSVNFSPPVSDWYGVVVVNDDGASGSYSLQITNCPVPTPLASGVPAATAAPFGLFEFGQANAAWTAAGVRSAVDWDLRIYSGDDGLGYPVCLDNSLAGSAGSAVDLVAGDFHNLAAGTFYVRPYLVGLNQSALTEWDDGADALPVNGPAVLRNTGPGDVLECWDVTLQAGLSYTFDFRPHDADLKLLLFSPQGAPWKSRSSAVVEVGGITGYTPPASGDYGVVVVNDDGAVGAYSLQVLQGLVSVGGPGAVHETGLQAVTPNPSRGRMEFRFGLAEPAEVSFQVLDVAGRVVASTPERSWDAGRWSVTWDGRGDDTARLSAGLYFVRMKAGDRPVGGARVTLIE